MVGGAAVEGLVRRRVGIVGVVEVAVAAVVALVVVVAAAGVGVAV